MQKQIKTLNKQNIKINIHYLIIYSHFIIVTETIINTEDYKHDC